MTSNDRKTFGNSIFDSTILSNSVGFDRIIDLATTFAAQREVNGGFPPYDIIRDAEDEFTITMALAGYDESDIDIEQDGGKLYIKSVKKASEDEDSDKEEYPKVLYNGIAKRAFNRCFQLADHVYVKDAKMENGLLFVQLEREVPEELKPRKIKITK